MLDTVQSADRGAITNLSNLAVAVVEEIHQLVKLEYNHEKDREFCAPLLALLASCAVLSRLICDWSSATLFFSSPTQSGGPPDVTGRSIHLCLFTTRRSKRKSG